MKELPLHQPGQQNSPMEGVDLPTQSTSAEKETLDEQWHALKLTYNAGALKELEEWARKEREARSNSFQIPYSVILDKKLP